MFKMFNIPCHSGWHSSREPQDMRTLQSAYTARAAATVLRMQASEFRGRPTRHQDRLPPVIVDSIIV